jgi:hypothetical protein
MQNTETIEMGRRGAGSFAYQDMKLDSGRHWFQKLGNYVKQHSL